MLAKHTGLRNPAPAANAHVPTSVVRCGKHAVTIMANGEAITTVGGKQQHWLSFAHAEDFLNIYDAGHQDRAVPFASPGYSLVINGSLVSRAPQWVRDEADDQRIGQCDYCWYFSFSHQYGAEYVLASTYDEAMTELRLLIQRESGEDFSVMPF
jgi:hypothetical protein